MCNANIITTEKNHIKIHTVKGKGKVTPLQAQCGSEGAKRYSSTLP